MQTLITSRFDLETAVEISSLKPICHYKEEEFYNRYDVCNNLHHVHILNRGYPFQIFRKTLGNSIGIKHTNKNNTNILQSRKTKW